MYYHSKIWNHRNNAKERKKSTTEINKMLLLPQDIREYSYISIVKSNR